MCCQCVNKIKVSVLCKKYNYNIVTSRTYSKDTSFKCNNKISLVMHGLS